MYPPVFIAILWLLLVLEHMIFTMFNAALVRKWYIQKIPHKFKYYILRLNGPNSKIYLSIGYGIGELSKIPNIHLLTFRQSNIYCHIYA